MEQVGVALSLETHIRNMLGFNSDRDTGYLDPGSLLCPSHLNSTGRASKDNMRKQEHRLVHCENDAQNGEACQSAAWLRAEKIVWREWEVLPSHSCFPLYSVWMRCHMSSLAARDLPRLGHVHIFVGPFFSLPACNGETWGDLIKNLLGR
jgi:hypothetical protein